MVAPLLAARPRLQAASKLVHSDVVVQMHDKPSQALRKGRWKSSMWLAIDAVKKGDADVAVSAGNTGALMAMAKFNLRTMPGIDRPAIAAVWPTLRGRSIVLDLGASIGADASHLIDLATMGGAMARVLFGLDRPTVGLLNIGVEEAKGLEEVREAGRILREENWPQFQYKGFVEGDDIGKGTVDVVVTEGFAGNIALKAAEGTARQMASFLKTELNRTVWTRLGYLFARRAFTALANKLDPRKSNGGVFLGLNGIVIKSHGGTDAEGFAYAIDVGYDLVRHDMLTKIEQTLAEHRRDALLPEPPRLVGGVGIVTVLRSVVLGCGSYLPSRVLGNAELSAMVDTSDDWITQRTGIRERHIAADGETTSDMAIAAARVGARRRADRCPVDRPDRARDLDARQHLSGERRDRAGRARHHPRRGVRSAGGLLGLRVRAGDRRRAAQDQRLQARAGDRLGDLFAHSRLAGSRHLRAVRRWRGRAWCSMPRCSLARARTAAS